MSWMYFDAALLLETIRKSLVFIIGALLSGRALLIRKMRHKNFDLQEYTCHCCGNPASVGKPPSPSGTHVVTSRLSCPSRWTTTTTWAPARISILKKPIRWSTCRWLTAKGSYYPSISLLPPRWVSGEKKSILELYVNSEHAELFKDY